MRLLYVGIIALALLVGTATRLMDDAHAAGFVEKVNKHKDVRYYFHGIGDPRFLNNGRYADVTIKMEGETVVNNMRVHNGRGRMGGYTTDLMDYEGEVYVKFVFYEADGRKIREDVWQQKLKKGTTQFSHWDSTWRWGMLVLFDRTNPILDKNIVDVSVRLD